MQWNATSRLAYGDKNKTGVTVSHTGTPVMTGRPGEMRRQTDRDNAK